MGCCLRWIGPDLTHGHITMAQGLEQILAACDIRPNPALVRELVRKDRELPAASSRLYDDAVPFLQILRSGGVRVALVSNCIENTRPLLADLGISALADAVVLSCCRARQVTPSRTRGSTGVPWISSA